MWDHLPWHFVPWYLAWLPGAPPWTVGDKEAHLPLFLLEEKFYYLLELMTEAINLFTNSTLPSVTVCWAGLGLRGPGHSTHSGRVHPGVRPAPTPSHFFTSSLMWYVAQMHQRQAGCVLSLPMEPGGLLQSVPRAGASSSPTWPGRS